MVGVSKSVIQTVVGFFTFGGVQFHPLNILGLVMNIFGGIIYTYIKNMEKNRKSNNQKYRNTFNYGNLMSTTNLASKFHIFKTKKSTIESVMIAVWKMVSMRTI